jgi:hypothetical protein|tara:strand:- start:972 stop:1508 length:537 start_codon:yes stop_codon:yes gene_type:complete
MRKMAEATAIALTPNLLKADEPKTWPSIFNTENKYMGTKPEWVHIGQTDEKTFNRTRYPKSKFGNLHTIAEITGDSKDRLRLKSTGDFHYIEHLGEGEYKNNGHGKKVTRLELHHESWGENKKKSPVLSKEFHYGNTHDRPYFHEQVIRFGIDRKGNRSMAVYDQANQKIYVFMKKKK